MLTGQGWPTVLPAPSMHELLKLGNSALDSFDQFDSGWQQKEWVDDLQQTLLDINSAAQNPVDDEEAGGGLIIFLYIVMAS